MRSIYFWKGLTLDLSGNDQPTLVHQHFWQSVYRKLPFCVTCEFLGQPCRPVTVMRFTFTAIQGRTLCLVFRARARAGGSTLRHRSRVPAVSRAVLVARLRAPLTPF